MDSKKGVSLKIVFIICGIKLGLSLIFVWIYLRYVEERQINRVEQIYNFFNNKSSAIEDTVSQNQQQKIGPKGPPGPQGAVGPAGGVFQAQGYIKNLDKSLGDNSFINRTYGKNQYTHAFLQPNTYHTNMFWTYTSPDNQHGENRLMNHFYDGENSAQCLSIEKTTKDIIMEKCDKTNTNQKWFWNKYNQFQGSGNNCLSYKDDTLNKDNSLGLINEKGERNVITNPVPIKRLFLTQCDTSDVKQKFTFI